MKFKKVIGILVVASLALAAIACQETPLPTATPVQFSPTAAPAGSPQPTATRTTSPTAAAQPTATPAAPAGNAAKGQTLFSQNGCSACHSTGTNTVLGPGLAGIGDRAATRVSGLAADAYIEQSIRDPGSFLAPGFSNLMPATFGALPAADVADIIAYLKTLK